MAGRGANHPVHNPVRYPVERHNGTNRRKPRGRTPELSLAEDRLRRAVERSRTIEPGNFPPQTPSPAAASRWLRWRLGPIRFLAERTTAFGKTQPTAERRQLGRLADVAAAGGVASAADPHGGVDHFCASRTTDLTAEDAAIKIAPVIPATIRIGPRRNGASKTAHPSMLA